MKQSRRVSIDTGEPPAEVAQQASYVAKLLARKPNDTPAEASEEEELLGEDEEIAPAPRPAPRVRSAPALTLKTQKLIIDHALFSLALDIYDFQVSESFISFSVDYNTTQLPEFKDICNLELRQGGRTYPVTFVGQYFNFPQHRIKAFAFVRRKEDETNDQTRKNREGVDPVGEDGKTGDQD